MEHDAELGVKTVLYGQPYRDAAGDDHLADTDMVILTMHIAGEPRTQCFFTAEQAIDAGHALVRAAGRVIGAERTDDGKPTTLLHRLTRLNRKAPTA